jgi:hypothetical protein
VDQSLLVKIREARERIESRGRALRTLIELGEPGRQTRAASVVPLIQNLSATETGVEALVPSEDGKAAYKVSITIHRRASGQEVCQGQTCTCWDHGRVGSCKHVLAVAAKWIRAHQSDWAALKKAEAILTPSSP